MAYNFRKNPINNEPELVIDGFENGIAKSPHRGIANMQAVNIATETGEVMCSFNRFKQSQTGTTGTFTQVNTNTVSVSGITLQVGQVVTVTADSGTGLLNNTASVLVVAGGGGGGSSYNVGGTGGGAGGGAGAVRTGNITLAVGAYSVTVGTGGAGATGGSGLRGSNGADSVFSTITSVGGGGGGGGEASTRTGANGGSGGGANLAGNLPGTGTTGGNDGGSGSATTTGNGGGGGGAGAVGGNAGATSGGNGGAGVANSISGSSITYGGGGGGGGESGQGTGGAGGGGAASLNGAGTNGTANRGGGGGGTGDPANANAGGTGGSGIVVVSYPTSGSITATGGTITTSGGNTIHTFTTSGTLTVTSSTSKYYYLSTGKLYAGSLPPSDPATATAVTGITSGTATFSITYPLGSPIQSATETYTDVNGAVQYRYYILDSTGSVWCRDTFTLTGVDTPEWFFVGTAGSGASGLAVFNGWLTVSQPTGFSTYWKLTSLFGSAWADTAGVIAFESKSNHFMLAGNQGKLYGTDGTTITSLFPNTSLLTGAANIQSYGSWTVLTATTAAVNIIGGSVPTTGTFSPRIPALFFTSGTLPSSMSAATVYWIQYRPTYIEVYDASSGGSAKNIQTGATGNQYFNTFDPTTTAGQTMLTFSPQRINFPFYEQVQCMAEVGNLVIIGGRRNILYPWNQVDVLPADVIPLPENNTVNIITVNNVAYVFTGQKGNIYITNGSSVSLVTSVPDYCAGIAGTPSSYIEPYFTWGGAMYMRGRVWFSILDQTSTKAGNCGGIWSFVPSQNFSSEQDTGLALRVENQSSYGSYNGYAKVLLPSQQQSAIGPQYWTGWDSSISAPTYGIDFSDTITTPSAVIESDLVETGTMLNKKTWKQIEYKLSAPLAAGETVTMSYRQNITDAYTSIGTFNVESTTGLSGYVPVNFQNGQWLQLKVSLNPLASSSSSFVRLKEVIVR